MVKLNNNEINNTLDLELGKQNSVDDFNRLLESGIEKQNINDVDRAIKYGADINGKCRLYGDFSGPEDEASALSLAIKYAAYAECDKRKVKNFEIASKIIEKLINAGADVNKDNPLASVAFIQCYNTGKESRTAEALLEAGSEINDDTIKELLKGENNKLLDQFIKHGYKSTGDDLRQLLKRSPSPDMSHHNSVKKMIVSLLESNPQVVNVIDEYISKSKPYGIMDASYTVIKDQRWHTYPEIQTAMRLAKVKVAQERRDSLAGAKTEEKATGVSKQTRSTQLSVKDMKNAKDDLVK